MNAVNLDIARFCAWAPGVESPADWLSWARGAIPVGDQGSPALSFLPAMFRRRLSRLSRMALQVAFACAGDRGALPTVFSSRHGELTRTLDLLVGQARGEALSPTDFSMSVHNTASGLFSIASGNTAPATVVAAMADSLPAAFIEAAAQLARGDAEQVLVVDADEPVAEPYRGFLPQRECPYAAAFLLTAPSTFDATASVARAENLGAQRLRLSFTRSDAAHVANSENGEQHALALLRFLLAQQASPRLAVQGERLTWEYAR